MGPLELLVLVLVIVAPIGALLLLVRLVGRSVAARRSGPHPARAARAEDAEPRPGTAPAGSLERRS